MRRRRTPLQAGEVMHSLLGRLAPPGLLPAAQAAWRSTAGDAIASRAHPVAERDGVLTIACESAVWAQELSMMEVQLRERLGRELGTERLVALRFVVSSDAD